MARIKLMVILLAAAMLAGCGIFKRDKPPAYVESREVEPIKVPEDLNRPRTDTSLIIQGRQTAPLTQAPDDTRPPRVGSSEPGSGSLLHDAGGSYMLVKDSVESTQRRLALSIERSGMTMLASDPASRTIRFAYQDSAPKPKKGFFRRLAFWKDDPADHSGEYIARLEADGEDSKVYLEGASGGQVTEAVAEAVLRIIVQRLG